MRFPLFGLLVLATFVAATPASAQLPVSVSGTIASGAQYDLWAVELAAGAQIAATLVCDFDGVSRPLDPVLTVFYPGNTGTDDTANADEYDDDGFGLDDDPNGVDCDAFDSSRVIFIPPVSGVYTFRADGFGSSTGPYTLSVFSQPSLLEIPTLDTVGLVSLALLLGAGAILILRRRRAA